MERKRYQTASDPLLLIPLGALITIAISTIFIPSPSSIATLENKAVIGPGEMEGETVTPVTTPRTNTSNVVLVHGSWGDGSIWAKVIPILKNAGHQVIAAQLPEHSLAEDVETVKRTIERIEGPTIVVGHSYGGFVITNAAYSNPNVTGLVYLAAFAPDQGETKYT